MATDPSDESETASGGAGALEEEVRALRQEMAYLRKHRMFQLYQSVTRILLFRLATGMAVGLGTVIGATVLLSLIIWSLSQIEFVPILGDWAAQIARDIEQTTTGAE